MRIQRITLLLVVCGSLLFFSSKDSFAHPGRTASDGCHYCRTRCDYWGVAWNQRHCHGDILPPAPVLPTSTPTPKPTSIPTPRPTNTPTPIPTNTPTHSLTNTPTFTPTPTEALEPEVKGETTEPTITSQVDIQAISQERSLAGLSVLSGLGVIGGVYWLFKRFRNR